MSLSNKVALVTGASSGIGAAIAIKLTEEGAKVIIVGRNDHKLKNVSEICEKRGTKPLIITADIARDDDVKRLIQETINFYGKLDILVNNAGISSTTSILEENVMEVYDKIQNTNLRGIVFLTHLAAKYIVESQGNIVNISSVAAMSVISNQYFAYATSKAGLDHFTRSIALELASKGVRVNTINPGPVKTDIMENSGMDKAVSTQIWESLKKVLPLGKVSDVEEVADLTAFLVSDKARSITGASFVIDNGVALKGVIG